MTASPAAGLLRKPSAPRSEQPFLSVRFAGIFLLCARFFTGLFMGSGGYRYCTRQPVRFDSGAFQIVFLPGNAARRMGFSPPVSLPNDARPRFRPAFFTGGVVNECKCILTVEDRFATWLTVTPCGEQASVRVGSTPALPMVLASVPPFHKERARPAIGTACAVFCQGCGTLRTNDSGYTLQREAYRPSMRSVMSMTRDSAD